MGADRADEFGRKSAVEGELVVRVRPTRMVGYAEMAGSAYTRNSSTREGR